MTLCLFCPVGKQNDGNSDDIVEKHEHHPISWHFKARLLQLCIIAQEFFRFLIWSMMIGILIFDGFIVWRNVWRRIRIILFVLSLIFKFKWLILFFVFSYLFLKCFILYTEIFKLVIFRSSNIRFLLFFGLLDVLFVGLSSMVLIRFTR